MKTPMFSSIRKYNAVPLLSDELVKHEDAIKAMLQPIKGFHAYYLVRTSDGAVSITLCQDKTGVEESNRVASSWLKDNLPTFATHTPEITVGEVRIRLEMEPAKV